MTQQTEDGYKSELFNTVMDYLCNIPIFDALKSSELKTIAHFMNCYDACEGDAIFLEGEKGDYVCFVVEGTLEVSKTSSSGERTVLTTLSSGHSIGEMSVIDDFPRSATVVALTRSRLITMSRKDFDTLVEEHPKIGINILKGVARVLSINLRKTSGQLAERMLPVL
jgi:CRP-like cAMP-binding protein